MTKPATPTKRQQPQIPPTMHVGPEVLTLYGLPMPNHGEAPIKLADIRAVRPPGGQIRFPLLLRTDGAGTIALTGAGVRRSHAGEIILTID